LNYALLISFVRQDLIDRYAGSMLGGLWAFILPLVNILIFTVIFSQVMGARLEGLGAEFDQYSYSIYLVSGVLAWNAFSATVSRVTSCFHDRAGMISKVSIRLQYLPLYILISEALVFVISMLFFAAFLLVIGYPITAHWWLLLPVFAAQQLFAYTLGFTCAWLSVFIRDIKEVVPVVMQLWFWCTPIVYVINILPESLRAFFALNPFYAFVNAYRAIIVDHRADALGPVALWGVFSLLCILFSLWLFRKLERDIRDFV